MNDHVKFGVLAPAYPNAADAVEAARRLDRMGWDFIDYPDQIVSTHPYGFLPFPRPAGDPSNPTGFFCDEWFGSMEMCSAASVVTERSEIILGVIDPLRRSPAVMAQEMVTLSHLSGGRMTFAIGSGEAKQFEPYGESRRKPVTRMVEAIHTWRALWNSGGTPVTRDSEFYPLKNAIFPLRKHDSGEPKLLMVGAGEKVFGLAGEICDGWLTYLPAGMVDDYSEVAAAVDAVKAVASAAGRDPESLRFNAMINMVVAENDELAWQQAKSPACAWVAIAALGIYSSAMWQKLGYEHPLGDFVWSTDMGAQVVNPGDLPALAEKVPDKVSDAAFVWGGPERVAARLQKIIDAGITEFCFMNLGAAADPEYSANWNPQISRVMELLGREPLRL